MFIALFLKEWKEKIIIFAFGLGLLALSLAMALGLSKHPDAPELVMGGLLVPFFSAMALLLGAGGFEQESRHDAWAYLFSRPIGKGAVWAVKYLSLLRQLAAKGNPQCIRSCRPVQKMDGPDAPAGRDVRHAFQGGG